VVRLFVRPKGARSSWRSCGCVVGGCCLLRKEKKPRTTRRKACTLQCLERNVACKDFARPGELQESKLKANQIWGERIWNFDVFIFFGVRRAVLHRLFSQLSTRHLSQQISFAGLKPELLEPSRAFVA